MYFNLTLPDFDGLSDESSLRQIKGYLSVLSEQLKYMMLNIDEDNLSSSLSDTIGSASKSASLAKEEIGSLDKSINALDESMLHISQKMTSFGENISTVSKKADKISLLVTFGDDETGFVFTDKTKDLVKDTVYTVLKDLPISFGITTDEKRTFLNVYDKEGTLLGSVVISQKDESVPDESEPEPDVPEMPTAPTPPEQTS